MNRLLSTLSQKWMKATFLIVLLGLAACNQPNTEASRAGLPDPLEAGWHGTKVCEIVEENDEIRILKCTFPPEVGHEKHYHSPHVGYTLEGGRFRMIDDRGTREVDVPAGYVFSNDAISIHEVLNIGTTTAQFLIIEYK